MPKSLSLKLISLLVVLGAALGATHVGAAGIPGLGGSAPKATEVNLQQMSKEELDAHLATLSDEEARKLLLEQVEAQREEQEAKKAKTPMGGSYIKNTINTLQKRSEQYDEERIKLKAALPEYGSHFSALWSQLFSRNGTGIFFWTVVKIALLIGGGWLAATFMFRSLSITRENLRRDGSFPVYSRLGHSVAGLAIDLLKVGLFTVLTVPLTLVLFEKNSATQLLASSTLLLIANIWAINCAFRELLFSPISKRLFIKGERCREIYYWAMLGFFIPIFFAMYSSAVLAGANFPSELIRFNFVVAVTFSILALIVGTLLMAREKTQHSDRESDVLRTILSNNKQWLVILALVAFYFVALKNIVISANITEQEQLSPGYLYYAILMFIFHPDVRAYRQAPDRGAASQNARGHHPGTARGGGNRCRGGRRLPADFQ